MLSVNTSFNSRTKTLFFLPVKRKQNMATDEQKQILELLACNDLLCNKLDALTELYQEAKTTIKSQKKELKNASQTIAMLKERERSLESDLARVHVGFNRQLLTIMEKQSPRVVYEERPPKAIKDEYSKPEPSFVGYK